MRITNRTMIENAIIHMNESRARLHELNNKVSSMKQFEKASDDPLLVSAALTLRSSLSANQAYLETNQQSEEWVKANDVALTNLIKVAERALTLSQSGLSDTISHTERLDSLAPEIASLLKEATDLGNSTHLGKYIFAGFNVYTQPYTLESDGSVTSHTTTSSQIQRWIAPGQGITINIDGNHTLEPLFDALIQVRDALQNPGATWREDLQAGIASLNTVIEDIKATSMLNGTRQRQISRNAQTLEKTQVQLKGLLSQKEDTNMAEAISLLRQQETVYQTVLEVSQRTLSAMSLFDFIS